MSLLTPAVVDPWASVQDLLHARGMRWTAQRRMLIEILSKSNGHVTGAELIERCRAADPSTTPSTVYRTLDMLEGLGLVRHGHGADGRQEFHVLPDRDHGHLHCEQCGQTWELEALEARGMVNALRRGRGFLVDLSHVTIVGRCGSCQEHQGGPPDPVHQLD